MTPEIHEIIQQQKNNTLKAYNDSNRDYSESALDDIVEQGLDAKHALYQVIEDGVLLVKRPYTEEELVRESYFLQIIQQKYAAYAFDFSHKQVTERASGKCMPLKKWLKVNNWEDHQIDQYLIDTSKERRLIIACNPWFLIGSSVAARGENVENSCHHPASNTEDYKSGAIAYSLDYQTIIFGAWDGLGLTGRQLVYVDLQAPGIVAGRKYGDMTETDSKFLRSHLYPLISKDYKYSEWKKSGNHRIERNGYRGYLDDSYFEGYRPQRDNQIVINLTNALCPSCGGRNYNGELLCDGCGQEKFRCAGCGDYVNSDEEYYSEIIGESYCSSCYHERFFRCERCDTEHDREELCECSGYDYCHNCAERRGYSYCTSCDTWETDCVSTADGEPICQGCVESDGLVRCEHCFDYDDPSNMVQTIEDEYYCQTHADRYLTECGHCGGFTSTSTHTTTTELEVCANCADDVFIHSCPACGLLSETPGVCCEECATEMMFKNSDNYMFAAAEAA